MKVIQVQTQAEAAGAQHVSDMVGEGLRRHGHEVRTVFMYRKTNAYDADPHADFILDHRPRGPLDLLRAIAGLIGYMRRARPDAVISYQHYGNIFGTLAGRLAGAKRLIANQSGVPGKFGGPLAAPLDRLMGTLGAYHFSVVNSGWMEAQFADYPRRYRQRTRRIDHGVEVPRTMPDRRAARAALGLSDNAYVLVSTGRLTSDKNQRALVEALADLPDVHLVLAGAGPEDAQLLETAQRLGVGGRLHRLGEVAPARIYDVLAAGDVFAFASRTETFGLSAAEAAIAGLPVVANDIAVLREVLADAAVYVDAEQGSAVAGAVKQLIAEPGRAAALAAAGRALRTRYAPERMCAAYEALLSA